MAGVSGYGVAGGDSEIWGQIGEGEPGDLAGFFGLTVASFAGQDFAEVGGRNPVLTFLREMMVGYAEEADEADFQADFLAGFADGALLERFEIVDFAADDAPTTGFGRAISESEKDAAEFIHEEDTNADAGIRLGVLE
jgi:hypothetical protein